MTEDVLRDRLRKRARECNRVGAHDSALRWVTLAIARASTRARTRGRGGGANANARENVDANEREYACDWRALASDYALKGEILTSMGNYRVAIGSYERGIACAERSGAKAEDDVAGEREYGVSHDGDVRCDVNDMRLRAARALCALRESAANEMAMKHLTLVPARARGVEHKLLLASIHRAMGNDRVAVTHYKDVVKEYPWAIEAAVALGELGVKTVDVGHALRKSATTAEERESEEFAVLETYASVLGALEADDIPSARAGLAQMANAFPNDSYMTCAKARADSFQARDVESAMREFASVRALDPYFTDNMDQYAAILYESDNLKALQELCASMMELTPDQPETWTCAALYYDFIRVSSKDGAAKMAKSGVKQDSLVAAEKAVRLSGGRSSIAFLILGSMCLKHKRYSDAVAAFNQCIAVKPSMHAYSGLVASYIAIGAIANAMMCAKQAIKRSPQDAVAWSLLGDVHSKKIGDTESAIKAYEQALAYNPRLLRAVKAIAALNVKMGKIHVARAILQRQLDDYQPTRDDELVSLYCRLAQVLMLSKQPTEGVKYYQRALAINPECSIAIKALDKVEHTRNAEFAGSRAAAETENITSDDDDMDDEVEDEASGQDGDWMIEGQ